MYKKILTFSLILFCSLILTGCSKLNPPPTSTNNSPITVSPTPLSQVETNYEFTSEQDSQVALDLLKANVTVETQDYGDAGQFVTSINGLAGDSGNYWAYYLNGEYAQQGVSQTILQKGDTIKFVYEAISTSN